MVNLTTKFVGDTLFRIIPDGGQPVLWSKLLEEADKLGFKELVSRFAFGAPESISRTGKKFTAKGKVPASTTEFFITINSEATVTFEVTYDEKEVLVQKITGVRVKPPALKEFALTYAAITSGEAGVFYVSTKAWGWFPVSRKISAAGVTE